MKFHSLVVATLLARLASAQSLTGLPVCAQSCVVSAIPESCNLDPTCICKSTSFITGITCCVSKACDKADQEATIKYANGICNPVGISDLPTAATCAKITSGAAVTSSRSATSSSSISSTMSTNLSVTYSQMAASSSASTPQTSYTTRVVNSAGGSKTTSASSSASTPQTSYTTKVVTPTGGSETTSATSSTGTPQQGNQGPNIVISHNHTGAIVGGVVGGILGLALLVFIGWFVTKKMKNRSRSDTPEVSQYPYYAE